MYIVVFVRKDGKPKEEYYYNSKQQAEEHFNLFKNDDSELYDKILFLEDAQSVKIIDKIQFE